ncbi:hypothetical protein BDP55DRAFT_279161 [Colletotrichum godetiae]|uniref:Uncharacterized protein n=1 Tax=Colletotrichum godetiae TaxID=1209918 RepID=A0AAJ0AGM9_9PEZI|nr:uncharacterized protein BDP55DRAFT_279161 [Colletotrichum godetiae]KAK1672088.1 hypothetical protein BDP55DRAFT_279161 [Colletotrichum godetiae]
MLLSHHSSQPQVHLRRTQGRRESLGLRLCSLYQGYSQAQVRSSFHVSKSAIHEEAKGPSLVSYFAPETSGEMGVNGNADEANTRTEIVTSGVSGAKQAGNYAELPLKLKRHQLPSNANICSFLYFTKLSWLRATSSKGGSRYLEYGWHAIVLIVFKRYFFLVTVSKQEPFRRSVNLFFSSMLRHALSNTWQSQDQALESPR